MFKICIESLEVFAIIGILPLERDKSQQIIINAEIEYDKKSDSFVDYAKIVSNIENLLIVKKYLLIEDALNDISLHIKENNPCITALKLRLNKPNILQSCNVGVEIFKKY